MRLWPIAAIVRFSRPVIVRPACINECLHWQGARPAGALVTTPAGRLHSSGTGVVEPDPDASYVAIGIVTPDTARIANRAVRHSPVSRRAGVNPIKSGSRPGARQ